jgi:hypothetical protein
MRGGLAKIETENQYLSVFYMILNLVMTLCYNIWIMLIYIVAMTLSTFWVQDIFDELI